MDRTPRARETTKRYAETERLPAHIPFSTQDSADLLARISRSEGDTQSSWRRIEDQLKTLARRLEQTERGQTESSRAVSQVATEMNIASREHAQVLDQLGAHVTGLGDRLARLEQGAGTEGFKDAIKALHQGLSPASPIRCRRRRPIPPPRRPNSPPASRPSRPS